MKGKKAIIIIAIIVVILIIVIAAYFLIAGNSEESTLDLESAEEVELSEVFTLDSTEGEDTITSSDETVAEKYSITEEELEVLNAKVMLQEETSGKLIFVRDGETNINVFQTSYEITAKSAGTEEDEDEEETEEADETEEEAEEEAESTDEEEEETETTITDADDITAYLTEVEKVAYYKNEFVAQCLEYLGLESDVDVYSEMLYGEAKTDAGSATIDDGIYTDERLYSVTYEAEVGSETKTFDINFYMQDSSLICEFVYTV